MDATSKSVAVVPPIENPLSGVFVQICDIDTHGFGKDHAFGFHIANLVKPREQNPTGDTTPMPVADCAQLPAGRRSCKPRHHCSQAGVRPHSTHRRHAHGAN